MPLLKCYQNRNNKSIVWQGHFFDRLMHFYLYFIIGFFKVRQISKTNRKSLRSFKVCELFLLVWKSSSLDPPPLVLISPATTAGCFHPPYFWNPRQLNPRWKMEKWPRRFLRSQANRSPFSGWTRGLNSWLEVLRLEFFFNPKRFSSLAMLYAWWQKIILQISTTSNFV